MELLRGWPAKAWQNWQKKINVMKKSDAKLPISHKFLDQQSRECQVVSRDKEQKDHNEDSLFFYR
jgi:hypothetical protein